MSIWPLPGVSGAGLSLLLREVEFSVSNAVVAMSPDEVLRSYLKWASDANRLLRNKIRIQDINRLVLTQRYWSTLAVTIDPQILQQTLVEELHSCEKAIKEARDDIDSRLYSWLRGGRVGAPPAFVVPDTNVFLQHPEFFDQIDWHALLAQTVRSMTDICVVVPILVVDELDRSKRNETRSRARQTLKRLYEHFKFGVESQAMLLQANSQHGEVTLRLLFDSVDHIRLPNSDEELISRILELKTFLDQPVEFITYDTGAALRAIAGGLPTLRLEEAAVLAVQPK